MPASNYAEKLMLEWGLQGKAPALPAKVYIALCEKPITKAMTGTNLAEAGEAAELNYTGYARIEIPLAEWTFVSGSGETTPTKVTNKAVITIKNNEGVINRSLAKYFAICDKVTVGNVLFFGKLTAELNITNVLTKVEIEIGQLEITAE